jgi:hypothetical protein
LHPPTKSGCILGIGEKNVNKQPMLNGNSSENDVFILGGEPLHERLLRSSFCLTAQRLRREASVSVGVVRGGRRPHTTPLTETPAKRRRR